MGTGLLQDSNEVLRAVRAVAAEVWDDYTERDLIALETAYRAGMHAALVQWITKEQK